MRQRRTHLSSARGARSARQLVLFSAGAGPAAAGILHQATGLRVASSRDFDGALRHAPPAPGEAIVFERLAAAWLHADPDQARSLRARTGALIEDERYVRAQALPAPICGEALRDSAQASWGLTATRTLSCRFSGRGVRVAILDTGLDLQHPDFAGRDIVSQSFVDGLSCHDGNGHGTFCAGVACGPKQPSQGPRYAVAFDAQLFVAKVLDDEAGGVDGNVLAGIDWAVRQHCAIVSMSLGTPALVGDACPEVYEQVAARALAAGTLLIAPAGNHSQRPDTITPVEHPADCPSILAVAALDQSLTVAPFSNGGLNPHGGEVDLAAPGISIGSAAPRPILYQTSSGTSMATPFVAGIAALLAESNPTARGAALRALLLQALRALPALARDVGGGLVQAPQ
jgi:subtilisin